MLSTMVNGVLYSYYMYVPFGLVFWFSTQDTANEKWLYSEIQ